MTAIWAPPGTAIAGRRDILVAELAAQLPWCHVSGAAAGLHLVLSLPDDTDPAAVRARALAAGVRVANLDTYRVGGRGAPGLVLGYGNLADHQVGPAVTVLAEAIIRH